MRQQVCDEGFDDEDGNAPTRSLCINRWRDAIEQCERDWNKLDPEGLTQRARCKDFAGAEFRRCRELSRPDTCDGLYLADVSVLTGVFSVGRVAAAVSEIGTIELTPSPACLVDRVTIEVHMPPRFDGVDSPGPRWLVVDDAGVGTDGVLRGTFDFAGLTKKNAFREALVFVRWYAGGVDVDAMHVELAIDETGVPGDYNRDAAADGDDVLAYMTSYIEGDRRADLNADADVDASDIAAFLDEFGGTGAGG